MPEEWDVDQALGELADAVGEGAARLKLEPATRTAIQELYRDGFEARTEAEWRLHRPAILDLARSAGRCAETATIVLWVNGIGTTTKSLDHDTVLLVCVIVSRLHCPMTRGIFCPKVAYDAPAGKRLDDILAELGSLG